MNAFKVTYTDGTSYETNANGTAAEFEAYLTQFGREIVAYENPETGEETRKTIATVEELDTKKTWAKENAAKDAFYGLNNALMSEVLRLNGYEMDGVKYPANSISLEECMRTVISMSIEEIMKITTAKDATRYSIYILHARAAIAQATE